MSITALEIQEVRFGEVKRGYDPNEVDEFLERVATDVDTLNRALSEAATRINEAETRAEEAEQRAADAAASSIPDIPDIPIPVPAPPSEDAVSADVISKAFIAAQKSADALREEARKEAEKVYRDAESKGRDIVREALGEKQKTLAELDRLRESSEQFRTEYLSLLKHFQADAQKRLTAFDDVVVASEDMGALRAQSRLTAANDAAVPAAGDARDGVVARSAASASTGAGAQPLVPRVPLDTDDDDLDIEEID